MKNTKMAAVFAENDDDAAMKLAKFIISEKALKVIEKDGVKCYTLYIYDFGDVGGSK